MKGDSVPLLSVVVPCYDEAKVIVATNDRLTQALGELQVPFEIIYVDDGSKDDTLSLLRQLHTFEARVKVISLARNFGHQMAVSAGIRYSLGQAVVIIDADLQDPPEIIGAMLGKWRDGCHVVYGVRRIRAGETVFKRISASVFYRMLNRMSEIPIPLDTGDFRLIDRRVVDALNEMPEQHRYIRGLISWVGYNQCPIYYDRAERLAGSSKYPLRKMISLAMDGLLSFSSRPLKLSIQIGLLTSTFSIAGILYAVFMRLFTSNWVSGWTLLMIAVLFLGGVELLCLGIIGEYVGRIYQETKHRPLYLVAESLGFGPATERNEMSRAANQV